MSSQKFATLRYTALRLGIFVVCFALVWALAYFHIIRSAWAVPTPCGCCCSRS